jgi:hypothetical protein
LSPFGLVGLFFLFVSPCSFMSFLLVVTYYLYFPPEHYKDLTFLRQDLAVKARWPPTHYPPASASHILGLQVWSPRPGSSKWFDCDHSGCSTMGW